MIKWRIIDWDTGHVYDFAANNPIRFAKKFIKKHRSVTLSNITLEVVPC